MWPTLRQVVGRGRRGLDAECRFDDDPFREERLPWQGLGKGQPRGTA